MPNAKSPWQSCQGAVGWCRVRDQPADPAPSDARRNCPGCRPGAAYEPQNGQLLAASFIDYLMPRADTLPFLATALNEVPTPTNRLGVRSGREGATTPALAAVINAIVAMRSPRWGCDTSRCRQPLSGCGAPFGLDARLPRPHREVARARQSVDRSLSPSCDLEPVPALDRKRHAVKITPVRVQVLKVDE